MRTKPASPPNLPPEAPLHLSEAGKALWAAVVSECRSSGRRALLLTALEARDRMLECRAILAKEGLTQTTTKTGAVHVHPLAKLETEARRQFTSIWTALHLQWCRADSRSD